ncbi:PhzF family phenazine biosynthesis protein [Magnetococcus sp. PR-3]|uniref:PhzF family phenazine biosynthesis protein n=1 Tax=Magnetococcus sp. PR-3 TaxID=3120355 RepID=UPI002FCDEE9F
MDNLFIVDAFSSQPFGGNPAAVHLFPEKEEETWMQALAGEMNLSETAFVSRQGADFGLRWFTPTLEVDLCGHATLAAAHILWQQGILKTQETARFHTRSGLLTCTRQGDWIEMDFPAEPAHPCPKPEALLKALGITAGRVSRSRMDYLVCLDDEALVRSLTPDMNALKEIETRAVIVTAQAETTEHDFVSRLFAPAAGIPEDPVTGSAHCTLAPYWGPILGKREMVGYQASRRGGEVKVCVQDNRVILSGQAVTVVAGRLSA